MNNKEISPAVLDHISVCVCTYKRPQLLANLLAELRKQVTHGRFGYSLVVIDNDAGRSAEPIVSRIRPDSAIDICYDIEPVQNIALARNRAVQRAEGNLIAFIDDDEIPIPSWLDELYQALRRFQADGILGPVLPRYATRPPRWVIKGRFCERPTYPTGFIIDWRKGRTGNILLKKDLFLTTGEAFDPRFGSGAEDQDFVRRMILKGHVFIWCNEARAYEIVPPIRWKRTVMIKRALLRGRMSLAHPTSFPLPLMKSCLAIPAYTMALPVLFLLGHHLFMQYLVKDSDHVGRVLSFLGIHLIRQKYITE